MKDSLSTSSRDRWLAVLRDVFILLLVFAAVFALWWKGWDLIDKSINPSSSDIENIAARGQFGDKFGAINALFAGFAFAGIIFTIFLQNREIHQSKRMLEEQLKDSNKQRFDSTFFKLISLHNEITKNLTDINLLGRDAFTAFNIKIVMSDVDFNAYSALNKLDKEQIRRLKDDKKITSDIESRLTSIEKSNLEATLEKGVAFCDNYLDTNIIDQEKKIRAAYTKAAELHVDKYSHYFRNLYHTLRYVDMSDLISDEDKKQYSKILRSQLSEPELLGLFYNSITKISLQGRDDMELGFPKMGRLLYKYDILQNMSPRSVIHPIHIDIFKKNNNGNT